ncbi:hypothetical protein GQ44DRAFT_712835 [Phaeosphaeriaceae sp. PMI808]|nr:hypothetical protein GQ44DRAFT_712835 [Phaeosphaeriaceae sp. PMI808]
MPYRTCPKGAYQEPYEKSYFNDAYTATSNYPLPTLDTDTLFEFPLTSVEMMPSGFPSKPSPFNLTLPATGILATEDQQPFEQTFYRPPFGQLQQQASGYTLDPTYINPMDPLAFSPTSQTSSRTPSLCGDAQQQAFSPSLSPRIIKRESPFSPGSLEDQSTPQRPVRKRGRPRLERYDAESTGSSSNKCPRTGRLPHNQVERKYREGLNSELERLRKAVPTLPQSDGGSAMGQTKPSKAMVLSSAIEYIKSIEKERDTLKVEVERLKQTQGQSTNWMRGHDPLDEFLMDP